MTISPVRSAEIQYLRQDEERCPVVAHVWSAKRKLREDSEGRPFHQIEFRLGTHSIHHWVFGLVDAFEFAILLSSDKSSKDLELFISATKGEIFSASQTFRFPTVIYHMKTAVLTT